MTTILADLETLLHARDDAEIELIRALIAAIVDEEQVERRLRRADPRWRVAKRTTYLAYRG